MLIKLALILSVILQFGAAIIAVGLIRRTKYNISWILISMAFVFMALRRVYELYQAYIVVEDSDLASFSAWIAVAISLFIFIGTIFIRRIFDFQKEVDDLKNQQEAKVLNAVIATEEKSKREFARNLHDGLAPILSSVKMLLSSLDKPKLDTDVEQVVVRADCGIDEAISNLKITANNLSPHVLESFGLLRAIQNRVDAIKTAEIPEIAIQENIGKQRFPKNIELAAYRIISELLINTLKHASADKISVHLLNDENALRIIYSDNGKGYNKNNVSLGMGISNIHSRIKAAGGSIEIHTKPNQGFYADIKFETLCKI
ncbi:MAG: histidine kinase [Bacteroidales bacterium]|jgi:signal transduction histidine kinase|nr:histidine kinase [Bacteroidales bacterium]